MLFKNKYHKQENLNDMHVDIGFSRKSNCFCLVVREKLGTNGIKFPAKGSLPVIVSSIVQNQLQ